jgi:hypothetical protein
MANDCLVKRLKGVVNNTELRKLGEFVLEVSKLGASQEERTISFSIPVGTRIWADNGKTFTIGETSYQEYETVNARVTIIVADENYNIHILNKYGVTTIEHVSYFDNYAPEKFPIAIDMSQFDYSNITNIWGVPFREYGTLKISSSLNTINLNSIETPQARANKSKIAADITGSSLTAIRVSCCPNVTGNLETLTQIYTAANLIVYKSGITGDVDAFAARQVALGKTSGTIILTACESGVTDEGNRLTHGYIVSKGGGWTITLTFDSSAPNGYTKAYTA